jgi:hypothetical protein
MGPVATVSRRIVACYQGLYMDRLDVTVIGRVGFNRVGVTGVPAWLRCSGSLSGRESKSRCYYWASNWCVLTATTAMAANTVEDTSRVAINKSQEQDS